MCKDLAAAKTGEEVKSKCTQPRASCLHICSYIDPATPNMPLDLQTHSLASAS